MNINELIAALHGSNTSGTPINVTINVMNTDGDVVLPNVAEEAPEVPTLPVTDFKVGDKVFVCHIKKDGTGTKHTFGTVTEVQQHDKNGWYTRVTGNNGNHYRTGLLMNQERLGSKIVFKVDEDDDEDGYDF